MRSARSGARTSATSARTCALSPASRASVTARNELGRRRGAALVRHVFVLSRSSTGHSSRARGGHLEAPARSCETYTQHDTVMICSRLPRPARLRSLVRECNRWRRTLDEAPMCRTTYTGEMLAGRLYSRRRCELTAVQRCGEPSGRMSADAASRGDCRALPCLLLRRRYWQRCEAAPPVPACAANSDVLGLSRIVEVDTAGGPQFGRTPPAEYDFLEDGEVVLTFDDGPLRPYTAGRPQGARRPLHQGDVLHGRPHGGGRPRDGRRGRRRGHTVAAHTWSHANLQGLDPDKAKDEIELGFSAVARAWAARSRRSSASPICARHRRRSRYLEDAQHRELRHRRRLARLQTRDGAAVKQTVLAQLAGAAQRHPAVPRHPAVDRARPGGHPRRAEGARVQGRAHRAQRAGDDASRIRRAGRPRDRAPEA